MLPALQRAASRVLSHLGEDSFLRGEAEPIKAKIDRDVEMTDGEGNVTLVRYVSSIAKTHAPKVGDTLSQGDDDFKLDVLVDDNGYVVRHILIKL